MNTSSGPLDYLAAFAIVLAAGAVLGCVIGWNSAGLYRQLQQQLREG